MSKMSDLMDKYLGISEPKIENWILPEERPEPEYSRKMIHPADKETKKNDNPFRLDWDKIRKLRSTINFDYYEAI